jgi:hypothetical protein
MVVKTKIPIDIFACKVIVIVADDCKKSLNYYLNSFDEKSIDYEIGGYTFRPGGNMDNYYLFFSKKDLCVNFINHEKAHLTEYILSDRGIKPIDEIRSYLDGWISEKLHDFFKNKKLKIKNS